MKGAILRGTLPQFYSAPPQSVYFVAVAHTFHKHRRLNPRPSHNASVDSSGSSDNHKARPARMVNSGVWLWATASTFPLVSAPLLQSIITNY